MPTQSARAANLGDCLAVMARTVTVSAVRIFGLG